MSERNTNDDLALLADAFYGNLTMIELEFGGIGLDPKRPFGNSDVQSDILEIIGWEPDGDDGDGPCYSSGQRDYAWSLYHEQLTPYLRERYAASKK